MSQPSDVTGLLLGLRGEDRSAVDHLFPILYDELQRIAHRLLVPERSDHTLSTTALVHEAYFRMVDQTRVEWQDRAHFCAVAARAMRRILIDYARRRHAQKRGGKQQPLTLESHHVSVDQQAVLLLSLNQALDRLRRLSERLAQVVEMRFFGGMTEAEMAEVLGVSTRTVRRDWVKAKAWLIKELYPDEV